MRLRLAPVEYKECATAHCGTVYEGPHCPRCRQPFLPQTTRKTLRDRLILVDVDPPVYESTQRCRCTECKNLFDLVERDVAERAQCAVCGQPLFSRAQMLEMWKAADTLLLRARRLDRAHRHEHACPHCGQRTPLRSWCPLHDSSSQVGATGGLPQNPIVVWVRTFRSAESWEDLQGRDWLQQEESDEEWLLDETTIATEREESPRHVQKQHS